VASERLVEWVEDLEGDHLVETVRQVYKARGNAVAIRRKDGEPYLLYQDAGKDADAEGFDGVVWVPSVVPAPPEIKEFRELRDGIGARRGTVLDRAGTVDDPEGIDVLGTEDLAAAIEDYALEAEAALEDDPDDRTGVAVEEWEPPPPAPEGSEDGADSASGGPAEFGDGSVGATGPDGERGEADPAGEWNESDDGHWNDEGGNREESGGDGRDDHGEWAGEPAGEYDEPAEWNGPGDRGPEPRNDEPIREESADPRPPESGRQPPPRDEPGRQRREDPRPPPVDGGGESIGETFDRLSSRLGLRSRSARIAAGLAVTAVVLVVVAVVLSSGGGAPGNPNGFLETNAEQTGEQNAVQVVDRLTVVGKSATLDGSTGTGELSLVVERAPGSGPVDLSSALLQVVGPEGDERVTLSDPAVSVAVERDDDGSLSAGSYRLNDDEDRVRLTIPVGRDGVVAVDRGETATVRITTGNGNTTEVDVQVPTQ
jgi:flagellin FlaB